MADDNDIVFSLDLDSSEFKSKLGEAVDSLAQLSGKSKDLDAMVAQFKDLAAVGALVGAAFLACKAALSMVDEAESVRAINDQFTLLTSNAGISTETLRAGLEKAAGGLIDDTDLLKLANKSIVEMGESAKRLPEIMELARKATAAFGGELAENFQGLSQAMATGNQRMLRQYGIVLDTQKAMRDYAASIGESTASLTQNEQRQAIMNAALEKGKQAFQGLNTDARQTHTTLAQMKVTWDQIGESLSILFERMAGPVVRGALADLAAAFKYVGGSIKTEVKTPTEEAKDRIEELTQKISKLKTQLESQTKKSWIQSLLGETDPRFIEQTRAQIAETEALREEENKKLSALHGEEIARKIKEENAEKGIGVVKEKNFQRSIEHLEAKAKDVELTERQARTEMEYAQTVEQVDRAEEAAHKASNDRAEAEKAVVAEKLQGRLINEQTAAQQLRAIDQKTYEEDLKRIQNRESAYKRMLDNDTRNAKNSADGIARAFRGGAQQSKADLNNFGLTGKRVYASFENNAVSALQAVGAGTKSAADAAKGFLFGMLADEAEARGKLMLLASIWPPNPAGLAAGAGLIALSGFLRSQAGGGGSSSSSAGDTGGGGASGGALASSSGVDTSNTLQQQEAPKKAVTIQVMGSYFETEQTRNRLMQMIREESDATDFKLIQIGKT